MKYSLPWLPIGAILAGLAVAAGAFAAHGLNDFFANKYRNMAPRNVAGQEIPASTKYLQDFKTAAEYQMFHALALLAVGLAVRQGRTRMLDVAGWSFLLGIVLFSGSLYVLTLTAQPGWGVVTPFGGLLFLNGWAALAFATASGRNSGTVGE